MDIMDIVDIVDSRPSRPLPSHKRQQRQHPGALDGNLDAPLAKRARAGLLARKEFALRSDQLAQRAGVLVVHQALAVLHEPAPLPPAAKTHSTVPVIPVFTICHCVSSTSK